MKLLETADKRLACQLVALFVLTLLPISMIAFNGAKALSGILSKLQRTTQLTEPVAASGSRNQQLSESFAPAPVVNAGSEILSSDGSAVSLASASLASPENTQLAFGIFDPGGEFNGDHSLRIRHEYVSWAAYDRKELLTKLAALEATGFQIMLTIEPWPLNQANSTLLDDILQGHYDETIKNLSETLGQLSGPIYVCWGHEMDQELTTRYPWSSCDPASFVAAYRYVVDSFRRQCPTELLWVWAGVLKQGSLKFWPGEAYVDFIGMPIYSFPNWDRQHHGYIRDFQSAFEEKRSVVAELGKPLIITELGVSGSPDFESFWLHQAFRKLTHYPDLKAVVFFYARDSEGAWGNDLPTPDWRVHPDAIRGLVQWHLGQIKQTRRALDQPAPNKIID